MDINLHIHEIYFKESELFVGEFQDEKYKEDRIKEYGEHSVKCMCLYKCNGGKILIPEFCVDKYGEVIPIKKEKEIECVKPELKILYKHIFDCASGLYTCKYFKYQQPKDCYVFVCYREDRPNYVGICAEDKPLFKSVEEAEEFINA